MAARLGGDPDADDGIDNPAVSLALNIAVTSYVKETACGSTRRTHPTL